MVCVTTPSPAVEEGCQVGSIPHLQSAILPLDVSGGVVAGSEVTVKCTQGWQYTAMCITGDNFQPSLQCVYEGNLKL